MFDNMLTKSTFPNLLGVSFMLDEYCRGNVVR